MVGSAFNQGAFKFKGGGGGRSNGAADYAIGSILGSKYRLLINTNRLVIFFVQKLFYSVLPIFIKCKTNEKISEIFISIRSNHIKQLMGDKTFCKHIKFVKKADVTKFIANNQPPQLDQLTNTPLVCPGMCLHCGLISSKDTYIMHSEQHKLRIFLQDGSVECIDCTPATKFMAALQSAPADQKYTDLKQCQGFHEYIMGCWRDRLINSASFTNQQRQLLFGLTNLGNTCYFNSVLQALSSVELYNQYYRSLDLSKSKIRACIVPKAVEYFYDEILQKADSEWHTVDYTKKKVPGSRSSKPFRSTSRVTDTVLNKAYRKFLQATRQGEEILNPKELFDQLHLVEPRFTYKTQQDAQQCLRILMDALSEGEMMFLDLNMDRYRKVEKAIGPQKLSIVDRVFGSYLASRIYCNKCNYKSWTVDLTLDLQAEMSQIGISKSDNTIQQYVKETGPVPVSELRFSHELFFPAAEAPVPQLLNSFFKEQQLTKANYFSCDKCKLSNAYKRMYLIQPSPCLTIVLKRFKQNMTKDTKIIELEQEIDLKGVVLSAGDWKYELSAVIVHEGTLQQGHYTACVKHRKLDRWVLYSDQSVKPITWERVRSLQAYILFYTRKSL